MRIRFTYETTEGLLRKREIGLDEFLLDWNGKRELVGDADGKVLLAVLDDMDVLSSIGGRKDMKGLASFLEGVAASRAGEPQR